MTTSSKIEWTDATWNPVAGCSIATEGCQNCYAMRMAARLESMGQSKYAGLTRKSGGRVKWTGKIRLAPETLLDPAKLKRPSMIFVNSMSDLYHEDVPFYFIQKVFETIRSCPQHTFQILTKRAERLEQISAELELPDNAWIGVSVENRKHMSRIDALRRTKARIKFISFEPLIGEVGFVDLSGVDWAIVGGESGPGARPMDPNWARSLRDQCLAAKVAFHFKQWGGPNKRHTGRVLDGRTWDQFPLQRAA